MKNDTWRQFRRWPVIGGVVVLLLVGAVVASTVTPTKEISEIIKSVAPGGDEENASRGVSVVPGDFRSLRQSLTHEELLSADWAGIVEMRSDEWVTSGSYKLRSERSKNPTDIKKARINHVISVRKTNGEPVATFESDAFFPNKQAPIFSEGQDPEYTAPPDRILVNSSLGRLYALFIFGTSHDGLWRLYESDMEGHHLRELDGSRYPAFLPADFRFSEDYTTLSYIFEPRYHAEISVIDLLDPTKSVRFPIPGDLDKYIEEAKLEGAEKNLAANWVGSWQFTEDDAVEFMRYYARGAENIGYKQMSEKELWRYDMETGEFTLLRTQPFSKSN